MAHRVQEASALVACDFLQPVIHRECSADRNVGVAITIFSALFRGNCGSRTDDTSRRCVKHVAQSQETRASAAEHRERCVT